MPLQIQPGLCFIPLVLPSKCICARSLLKICKLLAMAETPYSKPHQTPTSTLLYGFSIALCSAYEVPRHHSCLSDRTKSEFLYVSVVCGTREKPCFLTASLTKLSPQEMGGMSFRRFGRLPQPRVANNVMYSTCMSKLVTESLNATRCGG